MNEEEERVIMADTARNIQAEIIRLRSEGADKGVWNDAITEAANCCNGYAEEN